MSNQMPVSNVIYRQEISYHYSHGHSLHTFAKLEALFFANSRKWIQFQMQKSKRHCDRDFIHGQLENFLLVGKRYSCESYSAYIFLTASKAQRS